MAALPRQLGHRAALIQGDPELLDVAQRPGRRLALGHGGRDARSERAYGRFAQFGHHAVQPFKPLTCAVVV
jgi:hypothetical protein